MTISAASLSHILHGIGHSHPRPSAARAHPFAQQLLAAQTRSGDSPGTPSDQSGDLLSSDMLRAVQTIK